MSFSRSHILSRAYSPLSLPLRLQVLAYRSAGLNTSDIHLSLIINHNISRHAAVIYRAMHILI
jgi:hypothetical protein